MVRPRLERRLLPDPWWDWDDIIDLDYTQEGVRRYMTEALKYWVKETGQSLRCDKLLR